MVLEGTHIVDALLQLAVEDVLVDVSNDVFL
jgi:hypothetical protein